MGRFETSTRPDGAELAALVRRAAAGDEESWARLVADYAPMLRAIAWQFRLPPDRIADLAQTTWTRLVVGIAGLHSPEAVGSWLAVTMRRLCLQAVNEREKPVPDLDSWATPTNAADPPDAGLLRAEQAAAVRRALFRLPVRQRTLLWHMATRPDAQYAEISASLDIPMGAIGPTRARGLGNLRRMLLAEEGAPPAVRRTANRAPGPASGMSRRRRSAA